MGWLVAIAAAVMFAAILVWLRWRSKAPWLGPLYVHELVKLARRGSQPRLRAAYAGLLLLGLLVLYLRVFSDVDPSALLFNSSIQLPQSQRDTFTEWFTITFFLVQVVCVSLITPVYAGGAIAEEKERKSLDFLQSSMLSNREIVLGKLAARLTFVMLIVLVGLPVLLMVMLFGGLDPFTIFVGFTITLFTMLGLAGFSLLMGVYRKSLRDALYWPYGVLVVTTIIGFLTCCCPIPGIQAISPISCLSVFFIMNAQGGAFAGGIFGLSGQEYGYVLLGVFGTLYGTVFLVCTAMAIAGIRPGIYRATRDPDTGRRKAPEAAKRATVRSAERAVEPVEELTIDPYEPPAAPKEIDLDRQPARRPRVVRARRTFSVTPLRDGDPFLWKERYFSGRLPVLESGVAWGCTIAVITVFLAIIAVGLASGVLVKLAEGQFPGDVINGFLKFFIVGTILGLAPTMGLRACGAVSKERQQQTLLSLLTIPEARRRILFAKWLAPIYSARYWLIAIAGAIGVSLFTGGVHPLGVVAGGAYLVGFVPFAVSFGLWLSLRCTTTTRAMTVFFAVLVGLVLGPPIFGTLFRAALGLLGSDSAAGQLYEQFLDNVNPIVGLWKSFVNWSDFDAATVYRRGVNVANPVYANLISNTVIGGLYLAAAALFGWRAAVRFERETV
jgi:ABC-type transport system involved in multi-copper enzyme maturation permease subunit